MDIKGVYSDLDAESISMAINGIYNDIKLKINNPANLILFKLKFGSEKDYEDALSVYIRHKEKIDLDFLRKKAQKMLISSNLESFLREIGEFLEKEETD